MAGQQAFQRDKTLDQKDFSMASTNALNNAVATAQLEMELAKLQGKTPDTAPFERIMELHNIYYELHLNKVPGNVPAAFPGSTQAPSTNGAAPASGDAGNAVLNFGKKHSGKTFAQVWEEDQSYIEDFLVKLNATNDIGRVAKAQAQAFVASIGG